MRLRHDSTAQDYLNKQEYYIKECKNINVDEIFAKKQPVHIEIGSGKGKFITTLAQQNPHINYIAIEKYPTVLKNIALKQDNLKLPNLKLMSFDAVNINEIFLPNTISKVYLNFSDPWPKARHYKRRLTYIGFLNKYSQILNSNKEVEFKTDNQSLIDFTLDTLREHKIEIKYYNDDLHASNEENIKTEYEEKFSSKGFRIHKVIFNLCE